MCHEEGPGKPGGSKLNGTRQLPDYADDVNLHGIIVDTVNKNRGSLIEGSCSTNKRRES
jgi:hypothetical protein